MAKYIDVEVLKEKFAKRLNQIDGIVMSIDTAAVCLGLAISDIPTADVEEVKHGYNKTSMHPVDEFWCSECGFCCADYTETKYDEDGDYTYSCECEFDYCPRCGAKMDEREDKQHDNN